MLQSIRDKTHGWIAGIIISLLILSFALWGIHSYIGGGGETSSIAKVNNVEITKAQLSMAYERLRRQLQMQYSSSYAVPPGIEASLKERALQTLIEIQVLAQASIAQNYRITSRQVDGYLESMPEFQVNNQFSLARFQQILATTLFSANDFLELIRTSLLIDQPRLGLLLSSFALPNEIFQTYALVNQERSISYISIPSQYFLTASLIVPPQQVLGYYNTHTNEFKTPEQVSIEYLELSMKDLMAAIHPSDQTLKNFYDENINSYTQAAQWKVEGIFVPFVKDANEQQVMQAETQANDIYQKLVKGGDFTMLAREYPLAKWNDKFQNWVNLGLIPNELQKTFLGLTKPGTLNAPVRVNQGYVILKLVDYKEAVAQPYSQIQNKVKESYTRQQAEEKFAELKDKLANVAYEHPDSLVYGEKALGVPVKTSELFTKSKGSKDDVTSNTKVREAAFSNDVLNLKNNSDVIQLGSDVVLVLRVKSHAPSTLLSLKTVEKEIQDKLKTALAEEKANQLAISIKQNLQKGATVTQLTQQQHLTLTSLGFISRHSTKVDSALLDAAFAIPRPAQGKAVSYATVKQPNGYAVLILDAIKDGALQSGHDQYKVFAEQIQNSQGALEYELYKQSLIKQSKIVVEGQTK